MILVNAAQQPHATSPKMSASPTSPVTNLIAAVQAQMKPTKANVIPAAPVRNPLMLSSMDRGRVIVNG